MLLRRRMQGLGSLPKKIKFEPVDNIYVLVAQSGEILGGVSFDERPCDAEYTATSGESYKLRWEERSSIIHLDGENMSATLELPKGVVRINRKKYKLKRQNTIDVSFYFANRHGGAIRFYRSSFSRGEYLMEYDPRGLPEEHILIIGALSIFWAVCSAESR
ncbi:hypothetical protein [Candidatus Alkanophaga liquidiphilum]|nr:MAG: hypothetical protein DRN91_05370 [Candidatus Alkanophagales archaeon]